LRLDSRALSEEVRVKDETADAMELRGQVRSQMEFGNEGASSKSS
jgi:hypothetical protein